MDTSVRMSSGTHHFRAHKFPERFLSRLGMFQTISIRYHQ